MIHQEFYNDDARKGLVINANYYPHLYLNALSNNNATHGAVISMTGTLTAGGYRRWGMGIANQDPSNFSIGYTDNNRVARWRAAALANKASVGFDACSTL